MTNPPIGPDAAHGFSGPERQIAFLRLAGEIDLAGEAELAAAARLLSGVPVACVYIDLAATTFAGSTLLNFLSQLVTHLPGRPPVIVCRANPLISDLIEMTRLSEAITMRAEAVPEHEMPDTGATTTRVQVVIR